MPMTVTIDFAQASGWIAKLVLAAVVIGLLYTAWSRLRRWWASRKFDGSDLASMRRRWAEIESMSSQPGEMGLKMAVMEADKLLDNALKTLAMPGNTLGERLKFAGYKWPDLKKVWWAHRVRNQLAHEASYHLDSGIARRAIRSYGSALKLMGAI